MVGLGWVSRRPAVPHRYLAAQAATVLSQFRAQRRRGSPEAIGPRGRRHGVFALTKAELEAIATGQTPVTKRTALALAECLIAVIDAVNDELPADAWGANALAYKTAKRVIGARVSEYPLP